MIDQINEQDSVIRKNQRSPQNASPQEDKESSKDNTLNLMDFENIDKENDGPENLENLAKDESIFVNSYMKELTAREQAVSQNQDRVQIIDSLFDKSTGNNEQQHNESKIQK